MTEAYIPPKLPHQKTSAERHAEELTRQQEAFDALPVSIQNVLRSAANATPQIVVKAVVEAAQGFPSKEAKNLRRYSQQS